MFWGAPAPRANIIHMNYSVRTKVLIAIMLAAGAGYLIGAHSSPSPNAPSQSAIAIPKPGSVRVLYSLNKKQNDKELISLINNAHKYIYFAIYEFTLSDVADALVRAKERGVDVRGIMDKENSTTSYETPIIATLRSAGIPIETQTHPNGIMHIKALVTENAYASGSYNWTNSATNVNDEVLEIGTDPALRSTYEHIIMQVLNANAGGAIGAQNTNTAKSSTATPPSNNSSHTYPYTQAQQHIGETTRVSGTVISVYTSKSGTTFFDYCVNYNGCPFGAVIFASARARFGSSLTKYQGENITVSGTITSYKGKAEIVLDSPSQISK